jgi:hypothetical protein
VAPSALTVFSMRALHISHLPKTLKVSVFEEAMVMVLWSFVWADVVTPMMTANTVRKILNDFIELNIKIVNT